jgi:hypothetical protein
MTERTLVGRVCDQRQMSAPDLGFMRTSPKKVHALAALLLA